MTATIIDMFGDSTKNDADARTQRDAVQNGQAMVDATGREYSAPSRIHLGILWGDTENWRDRDAVSDPDRRMVAAGYVSPQDDGNYYEPRYPIIETGN